MLGFQQSTALGPFYQSLVRAEPFFPASPSPLVTKPARTALTRRALHLHCSALLCSALQHSSTPTTSYIAHSSRVAPFTAPFQRHRAASISRYISHYLCGAPIPHNLPPLHLRHWSAKLSIRGPHLHHTQHLLYYLRPTRYHHRSHTRSTYLLPSNVTGITSPHTPRRLRHLIPPST